MAVCLGVAALTPSAGAVTVAPRGSGAREVAVGRGPGGRGLVLWRSVRAGVRRIEAATLTSSGGFKAPQTVLESPGLFSAPVGWLDAAGAARVLLRVRTSPSAVAVLDVTRPPGATAFGVPAVIASARSLGIQVATANRRGDAAVATIDETGRIRVHTARASGPFGAGEDLAPGGVAQAPAMAIDARGDLVVAYTDGEAGDVLVRRGAVGAPLGPAQVVGRVGDHTGLGAGIDDAGTATVAFAAVAPGGADALALVRAPAGAGFGPALVLDRDRAGVVAQVAAAGTTTGVGWQGSGFPNGVHVAVARGAGSFGRTMSPAARAVPTGTGDLSIAQGPAVAVDPAGDVLLTYTYGSFGAVHAALWRAGAPGFAAPRVMTGLRTGFESAATLLDDGRPLVASVDGGAVAATVGARGRPVALRPPRVTMTAPSAGELRRRGTVTVSVRCSEPCVTNARARFTTGRAAAGGPGQVIEQPSLGARVLGRGARLVRFTLSAQGRAAFTRAGRAQVKLGVTAANATGAARTIHRTLEIGRR